MQNNKKKGGINMEKLSADLIWLLMTKYLAANDAVVCLRLQKRWYQVIVSRGSLQQLQIAASKAKLARVERLCFGTDLPLSEALIYAERSLKRDRDWVKCDGCEIDVTVQNGQGYQGVCLAGGLCLVGRHLFCETCAIQRRCAQCLSYGCSQSFDVPGICKRCRLFAVED